MGQLAEAKARLASAGTEAEQAKVKIEHGERELKEKEPRAKKAAKEGEGLGKEWEGARKEREELKKRVAGLEWDEDVESELLERKAAVSGKMNGLLEVSSLIALNRTRRRLLTSSPSLLVSHRNETTSNLDSLRRTSPTRIPQPTSIEPRSRDSSPTSSTSTNRTTTRRRLSRSALEESSTTSSSRTRRSPPLSWGTRTVSRSE